MLRTTPASTVFPSLFLVSESPLVLFIHRPSWQLCCSSHVGTDSARCAACCCELTTLLLWAYSLPSNTGAFACGAHILYRSVSIVPPLLHSRGLAFLAHFALAALVLCLFKACSGSIARGRQHSCTAVEWQSVRLPWSVPKRATVPGASGSNQICACVCWVSSAAGLSELCLWAGKWFAPQCVPSSCWLRSMLCVHMPVPDSAAAAGRGSCCERRWTRFRVARLS